MIADLRRIVPVVVSSTLALALLLLPASGGTTPLDPGTHGTLIVGSDISYAPLEFYGRDGRVEGFDYDLLHAIGTVLGERVVFRNRDFDGLLADVARGRVDVGVSAITDTRAREREVDFIDYFLAGSGILVPADNPHRIFNLGGLCGLTADVQRGTSQAFALARQSKDCTSVGLGPVHVLAYATDTRALQELLAHRSDAHLSDYPVVAYLAHTLGGGRAYAVVGRQFQVAPYGIAVAKDRPALRDGIRAALLRLVADGTYDALLAKWNLQQGALRSVPVNAGPLFER
jgi:polar amino acid transport system substrate-binding protein